MRCAFLEILPRRRHTHTRPCILPQPILLRSARWRGLSGEMCSVLLPLLIHFNLPSLIDNTVQGIYESILVMLKPQLNHIRIKSFLFKLYLFPIVIKIVKSKPSSLLLYLPLHALLLLNPKIIHRLSKAWRFEIEVDFFQLFYGSYVLNIIIQLTLLKLLFLL